MNERRPMRVLSLYEGFFSGGARILHTDLVIQLHRRDQEHTVLGLRSEVRRETLLQRCHDDPSYRRLVAAGIAVGALDHADELGGWRVHDALANADVVLSLKEDPVRLLLTPGVPRRPAVVCLHRTDPENQGDGVHHLRRAIDVGMIRAVVCCARSTRVAYAAAGVPDELMHVIPNGVDLDRFQPRPDDRDLLRRELGIPPDAPVVLLAARYAPMKNVPLFLAAARRYLAAHQDAHVIMCGAGMSATNEELRLAVAPLPDRIHLLGVRPDMAPVYAAADVVALTSSFGEAAPLCLIEGMMCGAVPVTTDVGDAAAIVAGRGFVTPSEPQAIADTWADAVTRRPELLAALHECRDGFDRRHMVDAYVELLAATPSREPVAA